MRLPGILVLLALASPISAQPTTYTLQAAAYLNVTNFTSPCAIGPCASFPAPSQPTGTFTTNAPLAPNLSSVAVQGSVTSFSFNNGIESFESTSPDVRLNVFLVSTDASGAITGSNIEIINWLTGTPGAHATSDRLSAIVISVGVGETARAYRNLVCTATLGVPTGAADSCSTGNVDASSSSAESLWPSFVMQAPPPPMVAAVPVPTLSELALALLALGVASIAWSRRRSVPGARR